MSEDLALSVVGPALTISAVAERTGISAVTLRAWQNRYGLGPSRTTPGGHRRYTPADVARLISVQDMVARGVPAGDAARAVLAATGEASALPRLALEPGALTSAHVLAAAALDLDGPAARALLRQHLARRGVVQTWDTLLRPVLCAVGSQWPDVPHGVAVEHMLSHVSTVVFGETVRRVPDDGEPAVLLACAPGELHDLPLFALWAGLEEAGVAATLLGARTPASALVEAAERHSPALVVLLSVLPDWAHPELFEDLPPGAGMLAAGPGWDLARLPSDVVPVNDLGAAVQAVVDLH